MDLAADGLTVAVERGVALSSTGMLGIESIAILGSFLAAVAQLQSRQPCVLMTGNRTMGRPVPANQPDAASFIIFTIVSSTSCATPSSCGVLNIARRVVGFKVARMALPPSS